MDSYAGPDTRPAIHARRNKQPTRRPHRHGRHKVEDWRAISGCAFPIDGGTTSQSSKLQDNALSPTTGSGHVAVMHGGKQAPWHHSLTQTSPATFS
jgi:hypothetical protein